MKKLSKWNRSKWATVMISAGIFCLMLVLNILTPYICDDYNYARNFQTGALLKSIDEIIPSMYAHSYIMNGRLISHGLVQLFVLLPPIVFDVVNAGIFTGTLYIIHIICAKEQSPMMLILLFCLIWLFILDFGQVVLWQVGAINYFWALTGCILFITPATIRFRSRSDILTRKWHWCLFYVYAFFFGWYNEIASLVGICLVFSLTFLDMWVNKAKFQFHRLLPSIFATFGFLLMFMAPAQIANKQGTNFSLYILLNRFLQCCYRLVVTCGPLLLFLVLLVFSAIRLKLSKKYIILAGLFTLAGVCANFVPMFASYYPRRCVSTTVMMLVMACVFLAAPLRKHTVVKYACTLLSALTLSACLWGITDIADCYRQSQHREAIIAEAKSAGIADIKANIVIPETPYSGFWELRDLMEDPETWPNDSMAVYYQIDSIVGEYPE